MATTGQILGKAHKLCEWLRNENVLIYPGREHAVPLSWAVDDATKWYVGDVDDLPDPEDGEIYKTIPLRLPHKTVLIEGAVSALTQQVEAANGTFFALCKDRGNNAIDCFFFLHISDFSFCGGCCLTLDETGNAAIGRFGDGTRDIDSLDRLSMNIHIVRRLLLALHCSNVRSVDNAPPAALNKKRAKQGKIPLYTYKTLHVLSGVRGGSHDQSADDAEAKRSPRLHFRRGHVRRIGDGRITWVQQCMVGNRRLGVVEKAYALEAR